MLADYSDDLYTTFIGVFVFHNASISSFAHSLDQPYYPGDADQHCVMDANLEQSHPCFKAQPPFCATTTYLACPLPLATPNRFGQTRSLGADAPAGASATIAVVCP
jgi:hypothetical protein